MKVKNNVFMVIILLLVSACWMGTAVAQSDPAPGVSGAYGTTFYAPTDRFFKTITFTPPNRIGVSGLNGVGFYAGSVVFAGFFYAVDARIGSANGDALIFLSGIALPPAEGTSIAGVGYIMQQKVPEYPFWFSGAK